MENNNHSQFETEALNPVTFAFRPQRRRPLKSQTYDTFIRLLSVCRDAAFNSRLPRDDRGDGEVEQLNDAYSNIQFENSLVDQVSLKNGSKEVGDFNNTRDKTGNFACTTGEGAEVGPDGSNVDSLASLVDKNKSGDQIVDIVNGDRDTQEMACDQVAEMICDKHDGHCNVELCDKEGSSPIREQLKVDEEIRLREVCESMELALGLDSEAEAELLQHRDACEMKGSFEDGNVTKGMEQELHRKEMELEKLISEAACMESCREAPDEDLEDGEISGEDPSTDMLFENSMSPEKVEEVQISRDIGDKEKVFCDGEQNGVAKCSTSTFLFQSTYKSNIMTENKKGRTGEDQAYKSDDVALGIDEVNRKSYSQGCIILESGREMKPIPKAGMPGHAEAGINLPASTGNVISQDVDTSQIAETMGQDASASKNKRKRGPLTKEKKAKKKKKERIKRAEKNRKLGVKRLKLQPVVKPKKVSYCRHYLKGRCHEGEKCKYSHDTTPLTKSKPCCHFARNSCMKGDDCPYDHQLSKYPCDNYVTKGFCIRGGSCLFSHQVQGNGGSLKSSKVSDSELKSSSMLSHAKKLENIHCNVQNVENKSCSGTPVGKSTEHQVPTPVHMHTAQVPKGVNIFYHGKSPGESSKQRQAAQPSTSDNIKLGHEKVQPFADNSDKVNEVLKRGIKTPKGINFLSFGGASLDDSSGNPVSSLFPNRDSGIGYPMIFDVNRSKEITPPPKRENSGKVANLGGQVGVDVPSVSSCSITSAGKDSAKDSSAMQQCSSHSNVGNSALTCAPERSGATLKFQYSSGTPFRSVSPQEIGIGSSSKGCFLSNAPSSVQKALQSTLSFAAKIEAEIKQVDPGSKKTESTKTNSAKGLTVLDFLYG